MTLILRLSFLLIFLFILFCDVIAMDSGIGLANSQLLTREQNNPKPEWKLSVEEVIKELKNPNVNSEGAIINSKKKIIELHKANKLPQQGITGDKTYWQKIMFEDLKIKDFNESKNKVIKKLEALIGYVYQENEKVEKKYDKTGISQYTTEPKRLPQEVLSKFTDVKPNDPPCFRITLNDQNKRKIYILGSIHNLNPEIVLSKNVFEKILSIAPNTLLCTEHDSISLTLMKKLDSAKEKLWDIEGLITENKKSIWEGIKNNKINKNYNYVFENIQNLSFAEGVMLLNALSPIHNKAFVEGFEQTIKKFPWKEKDKIYLEKIDDIINEISKNQDDIKEFLNSSLNNYEKGKIKESTNNISEIESIKNHKNSNFNYGYKFLNVTGDEIKKSSLERNVVWVNTIISYLENKFIEDDIFIICGNAHLKGNKSFLSLLLERDALKDVILERMDNNGNWLSEAD